MTDKEFIKILKEEIDFCRSQLEDCDEYDREYYIGGIQMLLDILRRIKREMRYE